MKKIFIFALFCFVAGAAFGQFPANPNKVRLGNNTSGDGLVYRTGASPSWTPSTVNNAWVAFDTVAGVLYYYQGAAWNAFAPSSGAGLDSTAFRNDSLFIYSPDTTFYVVIDRTFTVAGSAGTPQTVDPGQTVTISNGFGITTTAAATRTVEVKADTAAMATKTYTTNALALKLNLSDTATMLAPYQRDISLTTTGTSGAATFSSNVLNIPQYQAALTNPVIGTGTSGKVAKFTGTSSIGNGIASDDGTRFSLDDASTSTAKPFDFDSWTTAARPAVPMAGDAGWNTTVANLDLYSGSAWENPVKSATGNGLGTSKQVFYADANGRAAGSSSFTWEAGKFGIGNLGTGNLFINGGNTTLSGTYNYGITSGLTALTTGSGNIGIGYNVLAAATTSEYNIGIGYNVLAAATTGSGKNIAIGLNSASALKTGYSNIVLGYLGLRADTAGIRNIVIGELALGNSTPSAKDGNIAIGHQMGNSQTDGDYNVGIGYNIDFPSSTGSNQLVISNLIFGTGATGEDTSIPSGGKVGIKVASPARDLHVAGEVRITDLATDTPIGIIGADADGDLGLVGLAGGFGIVSGSLQFSGLTNKQVLYGGATGAITQSSSFTWEAGKFGIGNLGTGNLFINGGNTTLSGTYNYGITSGLTALTTGGGNVALGYNVMTSATTTEFNVGVGYSALAALTTSAARNVAIGLSSANSLKTGSGNIAIGYLTLRADTAGSNNVVLGDLALGNSTASNKSGNIAIGYRMGNATTSGDNNVGIGFDIDFPSSTGSNQLVISNLIFGTGANGTDTSIPSGGKVGIKVSAPARDLHVAGEVRITDLTTDTPTRVVGADADGDLGALTLGTGVTIDAGVLNVAASAVSDGDKGDIDVTSSGATWTIDTNAVTTVKINAGAVTSAKLATGAVTGAVYGTVYYVPVDSIDYDATTDLATYSEIHYYMYTGAGATANQVLTVPAASSTYAGKRIWVVSDDADGLDAYGTTITSSSGSTIRYYSGSLAGMADYASYGFSASEGSNAVLLVCVQNPRTLAYRWVVYDGVRTGY